MWSAIPGEKLCEQDGQYEELGTKAVQGCAEFREGKRESDKPMFRWEQRLCVILSRRGY